MLRIFLILAAATLLPLTARAEPVLKIINFTAEWCPNCQILNPAINNALLEFPEGQIEVIDLDMTFAGRGSSEEQKFIVYADAIRVAQKHKAGYLWDLYGGVTGIAAIIAADTGEAIGCMTRAIGSESIAYGLRESLIIAERRPQGERMPNGADCPPALR